MLSEDQVRGLGLVRLERRFERHVGEKVTSGTPARQGTSSMANL